MGAVNFNLAQDAEKTQMYFLIASPSYKKLDSFVK
jgi:hypothetical protein